MRLEVRRVTGRGATYDAGDAGAGPRATRHGATSRSGPRCGPPGGCASRGPDVAAVLLASGPPRTLRGPACWWRAAGAVRASLRESVPRRPAEQRALVPALVDGDDGGVDPALADDFRATGLTHLLAVSGTNLTLVVGFLLVLARWCGCAGGGSTSWARSGSPASCCSPAPSRACCGRPRWAGSGCWRWGSNGRQRGTRALGVALVALLLVDPGLATSVGFALSVLATGGILLLAPGWRDALGRWLPRWLAEAVAVPAAAQLACTPLVAAISGPGEPGGRRRQPGGRAGGGAGDRARARGRPAGLLWAPVGRLPGRRRPGASPGSCSVARRGAALPAAAVDWGTGVLPLAVLTLLTIGARARRAGPAAPTQHRAGLLRGAGRSASWSGRRHRAGRPPAG